MLKDGRRDEAVVTTVLIGLSILIIPRVQIATFVPLCPILSLPVYDGVRGAT